MNIGSIITQDCKHGAEHFFFRNPGTSRQHFSLLVHNRDSNNSHDVMTTKYYVIFALALRQKQCSFCPEEHDFQFWKEGTLSSNQ